MGGKKSDFFRIFFGKNGKIGKIHPTSEIGLRWGRNYDGIDNNRATNHPMASESMICAIKVDLRSSDDL